MEGAYIFKMLVGCAVVFAIGLASALRQRYAVPGAKAANDTTSAK